jgi:hypothetical protein
MQTFTRVTEECGIVGVSQHVVGGVDFNRLREEAYRFIKFASGKGVVALFFELFSHDIVFLF